MLDFYGIGFFPTDLIYNYISQDIIHNEMSKKLHQQQPQWPTSNNIPVCSLPVFSNSLQLVVTSNNLHVVSTLRLVGWLSCFAVGESEGLVGLQLDNEEVCIHRECLSACLFFATIHLN